MYVCSFDAVCIDNDAALYNSGKVPGYFTE